MISLGRALSACVVAALAGWVWLTFEWVAITDQDMAPSLVPGDWVLLGPGTPLLGDVVVLDDPAWPGRRVLRRVLGTAGRTVGIEEGLVVAEGNRLRIREMGRDDETLTLTEDDGYLVLRRLDRDRADFPPQQVPEGQLWLLADNRIHGLDSRWWGPLDADRIEDLVWLRVGDKGAWRRQVAIRGRDGPWKKPVPGASSRPE